LYLADADHLDWGYIEMPPLLAVLGFISKLLGGTIFTVHIWGGLSGALTVIVVGEDRIKLKGNSVQPYFLPAWLFYAQVFYG
jgi:hypothetical protein